MAYQVGRFEPVCLVRGETITRRLDILSGASNVSVDDGGSYTLYDASGTSVETGTTSSGGVAVEVPADLDVGSGAYEIWNVTVDGGTALQPIRTNVLVSTAALIYSPVTNSAILASHDGFDSYPNAGTSWENQIRAGWHRVLRWLMGQTRVAAKAEVHNLDVLYDAAFNAAMVEAYRFAGTFHDESAAAWFRYYEQQLDNELRKIIARYDTTGDGVPDTGYHRVAPDGLSFPVGGPYSGGAF